MSDCVCDRLPLSGDGKRLAPGTEVFRMYAGDMWRAEVVSVRSAGIDVRYTNDSSHKALYATARWNSPDIWYTTRPAARQCLGKSEAGEA